MSNESLTTIVDGRYFWQLVFDYDNTHNSGEIKHEYKTRQKRVITSRELISHRFSVNTGFSYGNKQSASVVFEGVVDVGASTEYKFHIETAYELQKTSETSETIETEHEETRTYVIGPHSKVSLYQLCYTTDGVQLATNIFVTNPKPDLNVKLKFSCIKYILGFDDILLQFSRTFPGSDNKVEWERIRESIMSHRSASQRDQFRAFVESLSGITPGRDNKVEWELIRKTCEEIKAEFETKDMQVLFNKLLHRFSTTTPGSSNRVEWQAIRELSQRILAGMRQNF
ncbi:hypothetical protein [Methylobacterium sp. EM32]|uniref:hypothetical protein n=1 Tax=Methylobacterium sp. EM32 TaxID=3163481 RepID=UPI0033B5297D